MAHANTQVPVAMRPQLQVLVWSASNLAETNDAQFTAASFGVLIQH